MFLSPSSISDKCALISSADGKRFSKLLLLLLLDEDPPDFSDSSSSLPQHHYKKCREKMKPPFLFPLTKTASKSKQREKTMERGKGRLSSTGELIEKQGKGRARDAADADEDDDGGGGSSLAQQ